MAERVGGSAHGSDCCVFWSRYSAAATLTKAAMRDDVVGSHARMPVKPPPLDFPDA